MTKQDTKTKKKTKKPVIRKLTVAKVRKAIPGSTGIIQVVADRCKVARQTMSVFIKKNPHLYDDLDNARDQLDDMVEAKHATILNSGDPRQIRWHLERKCKHRGYALKVEQETINVNVDASVDEMEKRYAEGMAQKNK